ncbi:MAG: phage terminase large subunit [Oscillospiraceae bacterium]|nr:phage terminase large subunit [Oscillospiraceae bacterium]
MTVLKLSSPSEKQRQFMRDGHRYLAFGGARGGGKSHAVRLDAVVKAFKYPGISILIVRKTYPELIENHIKPMTRWLNCYAPDKADRHAFYNDQRKQISFRNGSTILFRYCDTERDAERFQGTECDILYVDEATQQPEETMKKLTACVRGVNAFPKQVRYTCNPGGEGHSWVKRLFIDRAFNEGEDPEDYAFIQSSVYDNKALMHMDPDYVRQLEALPPHLRDMWLNGNWDVFEGQFFEDIRLVPDLNKAHEAGCDDPPEILKKEGRWCHVIEPFDITVGERAGWRILRSYDFGYGKPFSVGWWAIDYDGVMYRVLELYGCTKAPNEGIRWTPDQQFAEIARIEREHPWLKGRRIDGVADPAIWDASRGESVADTALRYGIYFTPGDNNRIPGWMQFHYRLQFDEHGYSRCYVFSSCKAFIRTIPLMIYDDHHPEDLDTELEDHVADECRYAFMSRPVAPIRPAEKRSFLSDPLNQFRR